MLMAPSGAAARRRQRRLRAQWRHEQQSVAMALAAALHHTSGLSTKKVVERREGPEEKSIAPVVAELLVRLEAAARVSAGAPSLAPVVLSSADDGVDASTLNLASEEEGRGGEDEEKGGGGEGEEAATGGGGVREARASPEPACSGRHPLLGGEEEKEEEEEADEEDMHFGFYVFGFQANIVEQYMSFSCYSRCLLRFSLLVGWFYL